jgi:hypothetical protein
MTSLEILKTHIQSHGQHETRPNYEGMFWKMNDVAMLIFCGCGCNSIGFNLIGQSYSLVNESEAAKILQTIHAQGYLLSDYPLRRLKKQVLMMGGKLKGADFSITADGHSNLTMHSPGKPEYAIDETEAKGILDKFDAFSRSLEPINGVKDTAGLLGQLLTVLSMSNRPQQDVRHFFDSAGKVAKA